MRCRASRGNHLLADDWAQPADGVGELPASANCNVTGRVILHRGASCRPSLFRYRKVDGRAWHCVGQVSSSASKQQLVEVSNSCSNPKRRQLSAEQQTATGETWRRWRRLSTGRHPNSVGRPTCVIVSPPVGVPDEGPSGVSMAPGRQALIWPQNCCSPSESSAPIKPPVISLALEGK